MARPVNGFLKPLVSLVLAMLCTLSLQTRAQDSAAGDVRIVYDIAASMAESDPDNRRTAATEMLIDALAEDSRAGIWSYGRQVNLLMPHAAVDQNWRSEARSRITSLRPIAQYSNLGAVLDRVSYDFEFADFEGPVDVVLISDGRVSIANNDSVNQVERNRILDTLIPRFNAAGARIHTLALSDRVDHSLLEQLSVRTGGVFSRVNESADLNRFVLSVVDELPERGGSELPMTADGFRIDEGIESFTALFLHEGGNLSLVSPSGQRSSAQSPGNQQWRAGPGYSLVQLSSPEFGQWQVEGDVADARIRIVSDMNLRWRVPQGSAIVRNLPVVLELEVVDAQEQPVRGLEGLVAANLTINGEAFSALRWQNDRLRAQLPNIFDTDELALEVRISGLGFDRAVRKVVQNSPVFRTEIIVVDDGYQWRLFPSDRDLVMSLDEVQARVLGPVLDERVPFERHPAGYLYIDLPSDRAPGQYQLSAIGRVTVNDRLLTDLGVAPVTVRLPVSPGQPRVLDLEATPMSPLTAEEAFVKEPMPLFEELTPSEPVATAPMPEPVTLAEPPMQSEASTNWLTYLLFTLPGIVILALFYLFYQRLERKTNPDNDDLLLADDAMSDDALGDIGELDTAAGFDTSIGADDLDEGEPPTMEDVEPPTPTRTEAPRANMEDALDTSSLEQDDWSDLDDPASTKDESIVEDDEENDLFDISNIDDSLSDLDNLNLDEDEDPFAEFDDLDDGNSPKR
ncbi:MAG: VWA domain-containing protein [Saccharospirillum sp.]|nr:VWA domain-containing protein [Saccharospirillum sp.]